MVVIVAIGALCAWYARGVYAARRRAGAGRGVRAGQVGAFVAAMSILVVAVAPPLDPLADQLFSAHMIQHLLLAAVVPPLVVRASPGIAMLWALPVRARRAIGRIVHPRTVTGRLWEVGTRPAVACLLHAAAIWTWHAPTLYDRALHSESLHALEHMSLVSTGVLIWWRIVRPARSRRDAPATGLVTLFVTAMQTGILGALIALSPRVIYPGQTAPGGPWGLSPIADQQLAGLMMWIGGGVYYCVAMAVLFLRWLRLERARSLRRIIAGTAVTGASVVSGCHRAPATGGDVERGKQVISAMGCAACHDIAGVPGPHGEVGPPLTGVRDRAIIGGALPNTPANMALWIEDPPSIARNTAMPNLGVTPDQAKDIVAYLYSLK
jgi:cytochrome c oxidase assembly factor CtaG